MKRLFSRCDQYAGPSMRSLFLALVVALGLAGCRQNGPAAPPTPGRSESAAAQRNLTEPPAQLVLTEAKVAGYLRYQEKMGELNGALLEGLKKSDGGEAAGLALLKRGARAEALAREEAGLSEQELTAIDDLAGAVLSKRVLLKTFDYEAQLKQMEQVKVSLPEDKGAEAEKAIEQLRAQRDALKNLSEERKQFGERNVELLLAQEKALMQTWQRGVIAGGKR